VGAFAALVDSSGSTVGTLKISSIYEWDKQHYVERVYGTSRMDHPGANIATGDSRSTLVGGELQVLAWPKNPAFGSSETSPAMTRAFIEDRGWEAALAFQTRNPLHRAHEYALVHGVQELTRSGVFAGVVLHPLVGQLKGDDVDAATRMVCYRTLIDNQLLGQGDSDASLWDGAGYEINEVFELLALDMKMYYGGPSEAVMHGIYRQNHGFSHIVIGRKHADAPYADKTPIWGDFDAQAIFDDLGAELHINPVKVGFAAYYDHLGRVDLMSNHPDAKAFFISGTKVREILMSGDRPDPRIIRGEVADVLIETYKNRQGA
jgi:sulfate adenylyltransferase